MSSSELVEAVSSSTGLSKSDVAKVLKTLPVEIKKALKNGESVKLRGFGAFFLSKESPKTVFGKKTVSGPKIRFRQSRGA